MNKLPSASFDDAAHTVGYHVAQTVISKQHDYGQKNILNCPIGAELGIVVRLYDKLARLANLLETGATPNNESIDDTIEDIMGYGLILKMVREGTFTLPLQDLATISPCACGTCSGYCGCQLPGHHSEKSA